MSNFRFQDYVTSGAFTLSLARSQVVTLHRIASGLSDHYPCAATTALERKGLIAPVAAPEDYAPDRQEYRATAAGLMVAALLTEAGLTQDQRDATAAEVARLHQEVEDRRAEAHTARTAARSALARLQKSETDLANERAMRGRGKLIVPVLRRDPLPNASHADLDAMVRE
jgi:DNA-binding PadR family transcriptional regulator